MRRTLAALQRMEVSDRDINFRTLAVEARVSTAWLYGQPELRNRIIFSGDVFSQFLLIPSAKFSV